MCQLGNYVLLRPVSEDTMLPCEILFKVTLAIVFLKRVLRVIVNANFSFESPGKFWKQCPGQGPSLSLSPT